MGAIRIGFIQVEVAIEADPDMVQRVGKAAAKAALFLLKPPVGGGQLVKGCDLAGGTYSVEVINAKFTKTKGGNEGVEVKLGEEGQVSGDGSGAKLPPVGEGNKEHAVAGFAVVSNPFKPGDMLGRVDSEAVFKVVEVIGNDVELDDGQLVQWPFLMGSPWRLLATAEGSDTKEVEN